MNRTRAPAAVVAAAVAVVVLAGLYGSTLGLAEDADSRGIYDRLAGIRAGEYRPSRTWGVPLYELVAAGLDGLGGLWLCNLASLAFTGGALAAVAAAVRPTATRAGQLAFLAVALHPLVLSNASTLMETSLHVAFAAVVIGRTLAVTDRGARPTDPGLWAAALGLLLTRPDGVITLAAAAATLLAQPGRPRGDRLRVLLAAAGTALVAAAVYGALNGGFGFLARDVMLGDSWVRRVIRSGAGAANVLGALAPLVVVAVALDAARIARARPAFDPAWVLLAVGVGGWAVRYTLLPDELEYLLPALLIAVVVAARLGADRALAVLALSVALTNTVTVSWFARGDGDALSVRPALQEGALLQDWRVRRFEGLMTSEGFRSALAAQVLGPGAAPLQRPNHFGAFLGPGGELVVGRDMLYLWDNPRNPQPAFRRATYPRIVVCEVPLALGRGWRLLQPLRSDAAAGLYAAGRPLPCADLPR